MNYLEKAFDSFFLGDAKVAVIKGEWGVGKTHFWEKYIDTRITKKNLAQIAYSYVSLFGKSSLEEVRKSIFHSAKAITSDVEIEKSFEIEFQESTILFDKIPWINENVEKIQKNAPFFSRLSNLFQKLPFVDKFSSFQSTLEYGLVKNYIVCFDDMERKGKGLSVKEVMGLIDELAQRKKCKVVLIFNESSLDDSEDQKQFALYREKVVDIELNHDPSCNENLKCVFSRDIECYPLIESVVNELRIKNIRVLRKLKWMNTLFFNYFEDKNEQIKNQYILHAAVLCWGYYIRDKDLTYDLLKEQLLSKSWLSLISDHNKEIPAGEKKFGSLASNLNLSPSKLDKHISFFLEHGYIEDKQLQQTIDELEEYFKVNSASVKLTAAWEIYSASFVDNLGDFKKALFDILDNEIERLGLSDFSSTINILEEFGEDITEYISKYVDCHSETLKKTTKHHPWNKDHSRNKTLIEKIDKLQQENRILNIDDVSMKIAVMRGWGEEDIDFLCSLSKEDFKAWMKSSPTDLHTKVKVGLFTFRNLGTSNKVQEAKFSLIVDNVIEALKEIASENEFNRRRIKNLYEVE